MVDELNESLARALPAPVVPTDFRARVAAAVARDPVVDVERRRRELDQDYRQAIARLNVLFLRRCRDALLTAAVIVLLVGAAVRPLSSWLTPFAAGAAPILAGAIALGAGLLFGAMIFRDLFAPAPT